MFWSILLVIISAGVLAVLFGFVANYIVEKTHISRVPPECADWNKEHVMEKALFIDGILVSSVMMAVYYFVSRC
jgi:hypothetical protein